MCQHDFHRRLGDALVAVEIHLEALAQHRFVHFADPALPSNARVRHDDVDSAECFGHLVESFAHGSHIRHVTGDRGGVAADRCGPLLCRALVDVEERDFGTCGGERLGRRRPNGAGGAGDDGNLTGERQLPRGTELCLFERPVFHIEHVGFGNRFEAADRFGIGDRFDRAHREIGRHPGVLLGSPEAEYAEPRNERDAGQRIERLLDAADAGILPREIDLVMRDESLDRHARRALEIGQLAIFGSRQDERPILGPDRVIRRHHPRLAVALNVRAVHEINNRRSGAELEDQMPPCAFHMSVLEAAGAT